MFNETRHSDISGRIILTFTRPANGGEGWGKGAKSLEITEACRRFSHCDNLCLCITSETAGIVITALRIVYFHVTTLLSETTNQIGQNLLKIYSDFGFRVFATSRSPCRTIWSGRWSAQARNVGSQCWLSILDRWSIEAWMIIAGLYWLIIIGPKIGPDDRPRITARLKPMTFQIYNHVNNDNKI